MNVLFVNNFRGRGGGEEFLRDLLPALIDKGVKVGLVCRPGTPLEELFTGTTVEVYPTSRSGLSALTSVFSIARIIRRGEYTIINIQRGHDIIQSWISSMLSGRKPVLLYTAHVPEFKRSRFLLKRLHRIVTISRYVKDKIAAFHTKLAPRISIIHNGADVSRFSPENSRPGMLRKRFNLSPDVFIIGTVGDLWKNQIEFLDALVEIRKCIPGIRYALVASESDMGHARKFKERAAELQIDDALLWIDRLSKEDMVFFYSDIDIAVSTHRNEGFGIWILEALAMGKPVVAFNEGGIRDSLEGCPAGVLVNGSASDMAREVISIARDDMRLRRMSEAGPAWVSGQFSRERMVEDYMHLFRTIMRMRRQQ